MSTDFLAREIDSRNALKLTDGADFSFGTERADYRDGGKGNDTIFGNGGNDTLAGGTGNDILIGGNGQDSFIVLGQDSIGDFQAGETIYLDYPDLQPEDIDIGLTSAGPVSTLLKIRGRDGTADHTVTLYDFNLTTVAYRLGRVLTATSPDQYMVVLQTGISGGSDRSVLYGNALDDRFYGNAMANLFVGGGGNDSVILGGGSDDFLYGLNVTGHCTIEDFSAEDTVRIVTWQYNPFAVYAGGVTAQVTGSALQLNFATRPDNSILLKNVLSSGPVQFRITPAGSSATLSMTQAQSASYAGIANGYSMLFGGAAGEYLLGENLYDFLSGGAGNDYLRGRAGNDYLEGGSGRDTFYYDEGRDTIADFSAEDYLFIGNGGVKTHAVTFRRGSGGVEASLGLGEQHTLVLLNLNAPRTLIFATADVYSRTNIVNMTLTSPSMSGTGGSDYLYGGPGAQTLDGGAGADVMAGGPGDDTYHVDLLADQVHEVAGEGIDTIVSAMTYALGEPDDGGHHVENVTLTGTWDSDGTGNSLNNVLTGNGRNNVLTGLSGNDTLKGGAGNDALYGNEGNDVLHGETAHDLLEGGAGNDALYGGEGSDTLLGLAGADTLDGGGGTDWLDGAEGGDLMQGGAGNDTYRADSGSDTIEEGPDGGYDMVVATVSFTLSHHVEELLLEGAANRGVGNAGNNVIRAGASAATLLGGDGNDRLTGNNSNDSLIGEGGNDTLAALAGADTLAGGMGDDSLQGGDGNDSLEGGDGNDFLDGGAGSDTMRGGAGNDRYRVDSKLDVVHETADGGVDTVVSSVDHVLAEHVEDLELVGGAVALNGTGNTLNNLLRAYAAGATLSGADGSDTLFGSAANDSLSGGSGDDVLSGGGGKDSLRGEAGRDVFHVLHAGQEGGATVMDFSPGDKLVIGDKDVKAAQVILAQSDASVLLSVGSRSYAAVTLLNANAGQMVVMDSAAGVIVLAGPYVAATAASDVLIGDGNGNSLNGLGGDDTVFGLAGNDSLGGGAGNDLLVGGDGDDVLAGGEGNDTLKGGAGNDTFRILEASASGTVVIEDLAEVDLVLIADGSVSAAQAGMAQTGADVTVSVSTRPDTAIILKNIALDRVRIAGGATGVTLSNSVPVLPTAGDDVLTGGGASHTLDGLAGDDMIVGGTGNDSLSGADGNDTLDGGAGSDTLSGGAGNDVLIGGTGNDILYGGAGIDEFRATVKSLGQDTIGDFGPEDRIVIGGENLSAGQLSSRVSGSDLVLRFSADETITLRNRAGAKTVVAAGDGALTITLANALEGTAGNDSLTGGAQDDRIAVRGGSDTVRGQGGNDVLEGEDGNDVLYGDDGDDSLHGGAGSDTLHGGEGDDWLYDSDTGDAPNGGEVMDGGAGDDVIVKRSAGSGTIYGGAGNDSITAAGKDIVADGGDGDDDIRLSADAYGKIFGGEGNDTMRGESSADTFWGDGGDDSVLGMGGNDQILGGGGNDIIDGGAGNDYLWGLEGHDTIMGGAGNDALNGGAGDDVLSGGAGDDSLRGGEGRDTYRVGGSASEASSTLIHDFDAVTDRIVVDNRSVSALDVSISRIVNNGQAATMIRYDADAARGVRDAETVILEGIDSDAVHFDISVADGLLVIIGQAWAT